MTGVATEDFYRWWFFDERSNRLRRTVAHMTRVQAQAIYANCFPDERTRVERRAQKLLPSRFFREA